MTPGGAGSRRQRSYRTAALILRRRNLGEADRLLTLLTRDHGKVDAVAKGARKPTSRKTGHVELYTRADVLIAKGRDLDVLVQADLQEPYLPLREDLTRGAYANYVVELLDRFTYGGDVEQGELFDLLDATFARLSQTEDLRRVVRYYEVHLLDAVGFRPELSECVITREPLEPVDQYFSYSEGGAVSPGSQHLAGGVVMLPLSALKILRHFQRSPYDYVASLAIPDAVHAELERIMLGYLQYLLEKRLQSAAFIEQLRRLT